MNRLLTAVGHFHIEKRNKGGKIPVVILKNREYILDIQEFVVWSSLNWRILRPDQIRELYQKKELETGLLKLIQELERELAQARAVTVQEEVRGNWLQRSWRPLVMLTFASVILIGTFTSLPILDETSRFWDLLEIGLGGYVVGRSGEKIMQAFARKPR